MRNLACCAIFLLMASVSFGQDVYNSSGRSGGYRHKEQKGYDPSKLVVGGDFNLGYSGDYANIGISPKIGYKLTDFLAAGVGIGYQFYKYPYKYDNNGQYLYDRANLVFPGAWVKCMVFNPIFACVDFEYDFISVKRDESYINNLGNYGVRKTTINGGAPCVLVGMGIKQEMSERVSAVISIQYDVVQADFSPYRSNLAYRAGILVGF